MAPKHLRTARSVIDAAIWENRFGERLLYGFAVLFVSVGLFALIVAVVRNQGISALAGGIASSLFWPAMREARQIRKENMAIRLLEDPLSRASTATEAANALRDAFSIVFAGERKKG